MNRPKHNLQLKKQHEYIIVPNSYLHEHKGVDHMTGLPALFLKRLVFLERSA